MLNDVNVKEENNETYQEYDMVEGNGPVESPGTAASEKVAPIFEEIKGMDLGGAVNVLIQVAQQAQSAGILTIRDSVVVAQAINILHPGTI